MIQIFVFMHWSLYSFREVLWCILLDNLLQRFPLVFGILLKSFQICSQFSILKLIDLVFLPKSRLLNKLSNFEEGMVETIVALQALVHNKQNHRYEISILIGDE